MVTFIMDNIAVPKPPAPPTFPLNFSSSSTPQHRKQSDPNPQISSTESLNSYSSTRQQNSKQTGHHPLNPTPPKPPAPPPPKVTPNTSLLNSNSSVRSNRSSNSNGFRLADDNGDNGSVYSVYKQKIDQMFDSDTSLSTKNNVQARIDQMFTDTSNHGKSEEISMGVHSFTVDYLGSIPLNDKVTSLAGLQNPLRELYFAYKKITRARKMLTGRLEISSQGLKVQYQGERGDLEQMNSFPTIAVWSAVKFVINDYESSRKSYAFLPLITDPDNIDKRTLFRNFEGGEEKFINSDAHSPLFAVVMRKIGVHKQLECHGFVCQTSEDAIVIAATLYKALMSQMKAKEKRPKNRNGVTCMSLASSVYNEKNNGLPVRPPRRKRSATSSIVSDQDTTNLDQASDTQPLIRTPTKNTPRKSIKTRRAPKAPSEKQEDLDAIRPYEEPLRLAEEPNSRNQSSDMGSPSVQNEAEIKEIKPQTFSDKINTRMSQEQKLITAEIKQMMSGSSSRRGLKRLQSLRRRSDDVVRKKEQSGDILTKVTIPRSGSFLNAGGLTRYKSKVTRTNGQASGGSPLGFHELFNEFRLHEGLHSMDDILGVIIDPDGMSFNDLKPIYKEFLLKLSVTLTKDELYQRSKSIMRRQRKKILRKTKGKSHGLRIGSKFRRLKHVFQRGLRWRLYKRPKKQKIEIQTIQTKLPESTISSSSYDTRHFTPKEDVQGLKKQTQKKKPNGRRDRLSTSEESDFLSVRRQKVHVTLNGNQNRNSSSGYVSCSDCSYNSDSCTCTSADKCYCSLGNKEVHNKKKCKPRQGKVSTDNCYCVDGTLTFCDCDTDSCAESNKCYCRRPTRNTTLLEQLKQRGFVPPAEKPKKLSKRDSNTKSTKSLEYMHNPKETYCDKMNSLMRPIDPYYNYTFQNVCVQKHSGYCESLPVQYELFSNNEDFRKYRGMGMFPRALSESEHVGLLKQSSSRAYKSARYGSGKRDKSIQATTIAASTSCNEALSVKKTAEIAALFADMRLSQTTDVKNLEGFVNPMVDSNNMYNKFRNNGSVTCRSMTYADIKTPGNNGSRMIQNSLYGTGRNFHKASNAKLFNSKNGLYTIQSQSDDSRRSSSGRRKEEPRFFPDVNSHYNRLETDRNSLENSLGYLP